MTTCRSQVMIASKKALQVNQLYATARVKVARFPMCTLLAVVVDIISVSF